MRSWAIVVALCCPLSFLHACSHGEYSFVSPSLEGGLMYITSLIHIIHDMYSEDDAEFQ